MLKLARLDDRTVLDVAGEDARPFLHNLLSQDVESLGPGELRYGALLTPQGRLLHDLFLLGREDGVWIDVAATAREDLLRRLTLYKLRAKVRLQSLDTPVHAAWGAASPPRGGWLPDPRTPDLGWRAYGLDAPAAGDPEDYDAHRVAVGVPDAARDGLADRAYPIEADLDLLHAIDFRKGCFVGQETTSRMKRRGQIKTRLLPLAVEGASSGAEVLNGDRRAGEVTYALLGRALALLRLDRLEGELTVEGRVARVEPPAWFPEPQPSPAIEAG
jgi:hypothetical protein